MVGQCISLPNPCAVLLGVSQVFESFKPLSLIVFTAGLPGNYFFLPKNTDLENVRFVTSDNPLIHSVHKSPCQPCLGYDIVCVAYVEFIVSSSKYLKKVLSQKSFPRLEWHVTLSESNVA